MGQSSTWGRPAP